MDLTSSIAMFEWNLLMRLVAEFLSPSWILTSKKSVVLTDFEEFLHPSWT